MDGVQKVIQSGLGCILEDFVLETDGWKDSEQVFALIFCWFPESVDRPRRYTRQDTNRSSK